jgi:hypothetical protein
MNRGSHYRGTEVERPQSGGAGCGCPFSIGTTCFIGAAIPNGTRNSTDAPRRKQELSSDNNYTFVMIGAIESDDNCITICNFTRSWGLC